MPLLNIYQETHRLVLSQGNPWAEFDFSVKVPQLHVMVALLPVLKILQILCKSQLCFLIIKNIKNIPSSIDWYLQQLILSFLPQHLFVWLDNKLAASAVCLKHLQRVSEHTGPKQSCSTQSTCLFTKLQSKPVFSCFIWDKTHVGYFEQCIQQYLIPWLKQNHRAELSVGVKGSF